MRNFAICSVMLASMVGTARSDEPRPAKPEQARHESQAADKTKGPPQQLTVDLGGGVKLEMVLIPAGEFMMGSLESDKKARDDEVPRHLVRITRPFYLGKHKVTQEQWQAVVGTNPGSFPGAKNPVQASWNECQQFFDRLNAKPDAGGGKFQLPTEAQWEYACRAGTTTCYGFGDDASQLGEYAWYAANSGGKVHPVGAKKPNAWGLYGMGGNVWEWCADWYGEDYYAKLPAIDPTGPATGTCRVTRGGSYRSPPRGCRSASRTNDRPEVRTYATGLRVARAVADKPSK